MEISPQIIETITKHIIILNAEVGGIQIDVAVLKAQMSEVLWLARATVAAFVVVFVRQFIKIIKNNRNNK